MEIIPPTPILLNLYQQISAGINEQDLLLYKQNNDAREAWLLNQQIPQNCGRSLPLSWDAQRMQRQVAQQFYNPNILEEIRCILSTVMGKNPKGSNNLSLIKSLLFPRKSLSGGVTGDVYATSLITKTASNNFTILADDSLILKIDKSPTNDTLTHELTIGLFVANELRKTIPNFTYVYGGFTCSPIVKDGNGNVNGWCYSCQNPDLQIRTLAGGLPPSIEGGRGGSAGISQYVAYENVVSPDLTPAISLKEFLKTGSADEVYTILVQICFALKTAHERFDFTHNDLHTDNVLLRKLDRKMYIAYSLLTQNGDQRIFYVYTQYVASIIDYGRSHAIINGDHFGVYDKRLLAIGVMGYRSYPLHDFYQLVAFMAYNVSLPPTPMGVGGREGGLVPSVSPPIGMGLPPSPPIGGEGGTRNFLYALLKNMMGTVTINNIEQKENLTSVLNGQKQYSFNLPPIEDLVKVDYFRITNYLLNFQSYFNDSASLVSMDLASINPSLILNCQHQACLDKAQFDQSIYLANTPMNIYDFALMDPSKVTNEMVPHLGEILEKEYESYPALLGVIQQNILGFPFLESLIPARENPLMVQETLSKYLDDFLKLYQEANQMQETWKALETISRNWDTGRPLPQKIDPTRLNQILAQLKEVRANLPNLSIIRYLCPLSL